MDENFPLSDESLSNASAGYPQSLVEYVQTYCHNHHLKPEELSDGLFEFLLAEYRGLK